jgi:hypothetical protein
MTVDVELKRKFLEFLKSDEEFRLAVAGLIGLDTIISELKKLREDFLTFVNIQEKRWEENIKRWEENNRRWEENNRRWEEAYKRFESLENELKKLREETNKLREDFNKLYESVMRRMDSFERRLQALGARWGIESEEAFRNAMKGIIEELLGVAKVEKWVYFDEKGEVLGYPSRIEVDITIKDNIHILIEIKSSASDADISKLWRMGKLYEKVTGVKPKLIMVTPFIDEDGIETAKILGVEVYTKT